MRRKKQRIVLVIILSLAGLYLFSWTGLSPTLSISQQPNSPQAQLRALKKQVLLHDAHLILSPQCNRDTKSGMAAVSSNFSNSPFDPYSLSGIPVQRFKPLPVWNGSCLPLQFAQPPVKFAKIALASHPGSGSTWSRHLIQQLTGVYVGAVYNDLLFSDKQPTGFHQFGNVVWNGSCIAIKTHEGWNGGPSFKASKYDKAIVIIRDPQDAILAEFKRIHWDASTNVLKKDDIYKDDHFSKYFPAIAKSWLTFHDKWLTSDLCVLTVQYQHLKTDQLFQLTRIANFLGIDIERLKPSHLGCILANTGKGLKWPTAKRTTSPYTAQMNETLETYRTQIRQLLRDRHGVQDITF